jgi:hypothetical protein
MRPYGDYRPSPEMKCALVKAYFDLSKIAFVLEDRSDCCAAYFQLGLSVLQVSYNHGGKTNVEAAQAS